MRCSRSVLSFIILFIGCCVHAQQGWDKNAFSLKDNDERYRYVHDFPFWKVTQLKQMQTLLDDMLAVAVAADDIHTQLAVKYYFCKTSGTPGLKLPNHFTSAQLFEDIRKQAIKYNYDVERIVAQHYLENDLCNRKKRTPEQQYTDFITIFDAIEAIGPEQFKDYYIDEILFNMATFMWDMGDFQKCLNYLQVAEQFTTTTEEGGYSYTQVLSYLQSYWKQERRYDKSLFYAKKILAFHSTFNTEDPMRKWWNRFWLGMSNIEIADILVKQGKIAESEAYADAGYELSKASDEPVNRIVNF